MNATTAHRRWKRPPLIKDSKWRYGLPILALAYFVAAFLSYEVNWSRVYEGLDRGWAFIKSFANPDFTTRWSDISEGISLIPE